MWKKEPVVFSVMRVFGMSSGKRESSSQFNAMRFDGVFGVELY